MDQRNFKSTKSIRRLKNGVLDTFGEGIFKSRGRIRVTDPWGVESTQESKDSMEESRNCHQGSLRALLLVFLRVGKKREVKG
jgi:hypothetical protein